MRLFQMFSDVSVLFSDVVGFTHICSMISPMEVVTMLNNMYTAFDQISEQHNVYKVSSVVRQGIKAKKEENVVFNLITARKKLYSDVSSVRADCQRYFTLHVPIFAQ